MTLDSIPDYELHELDDLFVVKWNRVTRAGTTVVIGRARAALQRASRPMAYLVIVPDQSSAPDDEGRAALGEATKALVDEFDSMHCVIEGAGFRKSVIRGVAASVFLLSGKRGKMHVHDSVADAISAVDCLRSPTTTMAALRRVGLV